jgi:ABC-type branched-subunit amino acid transport system ATPase component/ABC-type branched-subunit amino acid transport system permease subunit
VIVWQLALAGLTAGGAYALSALGVVVIHRGSGVLNFAQGAIGLIAVYVFWALYHDSNVPLVPALLAGTAAGALIGIAFYLIAVRNLRRASDTTKAITTLGLLLAVSSLAAEIYGTDLTLVGNIFGSGSIGIFGGVLVEGTLVVLIVTVVAAVGLGAMIKFTRFGIISTGLLENPRVVAGVGISPDPTAIASWAVGGVLGALSGILLLPVTGLSSTNITLLIVPSMGAALVARFRSLSITVLAGLGIGVIESILTNYVDVSLVQVVPFLIIVLVLVLSGRALPGRGTEARLRLPKVGRDAVRWPTVAVIAALSAVVSLLATGSWLDTLLNTLLVILLGLSVVVVTGFAGQLSLAPFALAGIGALATAQVNSAWGLSFVPSVLIGTAAATVCGVILGAPAVRVRGIQLGIATLGLGLAVDQGILGNPQFTGGTSSLAIKSPTLFGWSVDPGLHPQRYVILTLIVVIVATLCVGNIRRGESGRRYLAVRGNERGAAAIGVSVMGAKLSSFAVSSLFAGLAGALTVYRFQYGTFDSFTVFASVALVGFVVVGGVGFVGGAVAAGIGTQGGVLSQFLTSTLHLSWADAWIPIIGGLAMIDVTVRYPDGIAAAIGRLKNAAIAATRNLGSRPSSRQTGRVTLAVAAPKQPEAPTGWGNEKDSAAESPPTWSGMAGLEVSGLTVRYGSVVAVDSVDVSIRRGSVLGVIGPNGAGKTSLIDAITGFAAVAQGSVTVSGSRADGLSPKERARKGLGRTFQNLELFEDLTVEENILSAIDRGAIWPYVSDLVWPHRPRFNARLAGLVRALGIGEQDLGTIVSDLPNGRRRLVAIARMAAREPDVMCLDEPAAGLSEAERTELSRVLRILAREFGAAVLLVEHNIDVVAESCDNLLVLDFGAPIASGPTAEVLASDAVRRAYLGETVTVGRGKDPGDERKPDAPGSGAGAAVRTNTAGETAQ